MPCLMDFFISGTRGVFPMRMLIECKHCRKLRVEEDIFPGKKPAVGDSVLFGMAGTCGCRKNATGFDVGNLVTWAEDSAMMIWDERRL